MIGYVLNFVSTVIDLFYFILFIRVICSWIPQLRFTKISELSMRATEPVLSPIRNFLMCFEAIRRIPLDMSFIAVYLILGFIEKVLYSVARFI